MFRDARHAPHAPDSMPGFYAATAATGFSPAPDDSDAAEDAHDNEFSRPQFTVVRRAG